MEIGIFSRTFQRPTVGEVLESIAGYRLKLVHFNLNSAGIDSLPREIDEDLLGMVRREFQRREMRMTSISATFNAIHPDLDQRRELIYRACLLIERARDLGASIVSLCTGTRNSHNMWHPHPENDAPDAWRDLTLTIRTLLNIAERNDVILGIEPERANVVNSAQKARCLLDEMGSPNLKIIIDGANLFDPSETVDMRAVLEEAFELLQSDIVLAHAKDLAAEMTGSQAAGTGKLDWSTYFRLLKLANYSGPLLLHNLNESQVEESIAFVAATWQMA